MANKRKLDFVALKKIFDKRFDTAVHQGLTRNNPKRAKKDGDKHGS